MKGIKKIKSSYLGNLVKTGVTNMVGIGMIKATSDMSNSLPEGTAKTITGIVPGLQSVSLLGQNLKMFKNTIKLKPQKRFKL